MQRVHHGGKFPTRSPEVDKDRWRYIRTARLKYFKTSSYIERFENLNVLYIEISLSILSKQAIKSKLRVDCNPAAMTIILSIRGPFSRFANEATCFTTHSYPHLHDLTAERSRSVRKSAGPRPIELRPIERICGVASIPSRTGICISIRTTSKFSPCTLSTASCPSSA